MEEITLTSLMEAGSHFGHKKDRWNPKMKPYIFTTRNKVHIFDLTLTLEKLKEAENFIGDVVSRGGKILFVGTKKQAQVIIKETAIETDSYYVVERWLGGMLTNNKTITKCIDQLEKIEAMEADGTFEHLTKKEVLSLEAEKDKLNKYFEGIRDMEDMPDVVFIVDPVKEKNATMEARKLNIPIVAIMDTNADPDYVDYIIPANDDGIRSISLILSGIKDAILNAREGVQEEEGDAPAETAAEETEATAAQSA